MAELKIPQHLHNLNKSQTQSKIYGKYEFELMMLKQLSKFINILPNKAIQHKRKQVFRFTGLNFIGNGSSTKILYFPLKSTRNILIFNFNRYSKYFSQISLPQPAPINRYQYSCSETIDQIEYTEQYFFSALIPSEFQLKWEIVYFRARSQFSYQQHIRRISL